MRWHSHLKLQTKRLLKLSSQLHKNHWSFWICKADLKIHQIFLFHVESLKPSNMYWAEDCRLCALYLTFSAIFSVIWIFWHEFLKFFLAQSPIFVDIKSLVNPFNLFLIQGLRRLLLRQSIKYFQSEWMVSFFLDYLDKFLFCDKSILVQIQHFEGSLHNLCPVLNLKIKYIYVGF